MDVDITVSSSSSSENQSAVSVQNENANDVPEGNTTEKDTGNEKQNVIDLEDQSEDASLQSVITSEGTNVGPSEDLTVDISESEHEEGSQRLSEEDYLRLYKDLFLKEPTAIVDLDLTERDSSKQKCMNALCEYGETFVQPPNAARSFYCIPAGKNLTVCTVCLGAAMNFFWELEKKLVLKKPICNSQFPTFAEVIIVDDDDESDSKKEDKEKAKGILDPFVKTYLDVIDAMYGVCKQAPIGEKCVLNEFKKLEDGFEVFSKTAQEVQDDLNEIMGQFYEAYSVESEELPSFDVPYEEMRPAFADVGLYEDDVMFTGHVTVMLPPNLPPLGVPTYPKLKVGDRIYAMKVSVFSEWVPSRIECIVTKISEASKRTPLHYYKVFIKGNPGYKKEVSPQMLAYSYPPEVRLPIGARVISQHTDPTNPEVTRYYSGLIAEPTCHLNKYRYLIFYEDGREQYVHHKDIRLICDPKTNTWEHFKTKFQEYIKDYFKNFPERAMLKVKKMDRIKTEYKGGWVYARVTAIDCSLIQVFFLHDKHLEWIYRGSPRLYPMYQGYTRKKRFQGRLIRKIPSRRTADSGPFVQYDSGFCDDEGNKENGENQQSSTSGNKNVARKSVTRQADYVEMETKRLYERRCIRPPVFQQHDGVIEQRLPVKLKKPRCYRPHVCNPECVRWLDTTEDDTKGVSPLSIPVLYGFARETEIASRTVSYIAPCGRRLKTIVDTLKFLTDSDLKLGIDCFDFDPNVNIFNEYVVPSEHCVLKDLSFGIEKLPIECVNTINGNIPIYMDYMTFRRGTEGVNLNLDPEFLIGCDCTDNCQDKSKCACWQLTIEEVNNVNRRLGKPLECETVGYQYRRLSTLVSTGIYECNSRCKCCVETCLNRVVQHPLKQKLQLFMTKHKGWGTRCLNDIPSGTFICVYVGNIFTEAVANEDGRLYGDEYFAELDYIEVNEGHKEGYEDFVDPEEYLNENQNFSEKSKEEQSEAKISKYEERRKRRKKEVDRFITGGVPEKTKGESEDVDDPDPLQSSSESDSQAEGDDRIFNPKNDKTPRPSVRTYYGKDEAVYIMDAKAAGNIGRYLNHSCDPNIFVQNVFVDTHDLRFPWVAFFSSKYIKAGTELTWDYRYDVGSVEGKKLKCYCLSENCRGRLL